MCSDILPISVKSDLMTESFRISLVHFRASGIRYRLPILKLISDYFVSLTMSAKYHNSKKPGKIMGPVDYLVVKIPGNKFSGGMCP